MCILYIQSIKHDLSWLKKKFKKSDYKKKGSIPRKYKFEYDQITIETSKAHFNNLDGQVTDTIKFILKYEQLFSEINTNIADVKMFIDFAFNDYDKNDFYYEIIVDKQLMVTCVKYNIGIQYSIYSPD